MFAGCLDHYLTNRVLGILGSWPSLEKQHNRIPPPHIGQCTSKDETMQNAIKPPKNCGTNFNLFSNVSKDKKLLEKLNFILILTFT